MLVLHAVVLVVGGVIIVVVVETVVVVVDRKSDDVEIKMQEIERVEDERQFQGFEKIRASFSSLACLPTASHLQ